MRPLSIQRKFGILLLLISGSALLVATVTFLAADYLKLREVLSEQMQTLATVVGQNTTGALSFGDRIAAARTLSNLEFVPAVNSACLYGGEAADELFASFPAGRAGCPDRLASGPAAHFQGDELLVRAPVRLDGEKIGELTVRRGMGDLRIHVLTQTGVAAGCLLFGLLLVVALSPVARSTLVNPVLALANTARRITSSRNFQLRAARHADDEIGGLVDDFNGMLEQIESDQAALLRSNEALAEQVAERTRANEELRQAIERNDALREALEKLEAAQAQLIEAENMASLGGLVAGVAHEVNNPIGISVTAASHLKEELNTLRREFDSGALKASTFQEKLDSSLEMGEVILSHLRRAAQLVASFKRVAIDRSSDEWHSFDLIEYLREVATSLQPQLRAGAHALELSVDWEGELLMQSFPGAVAQVVTNLVINAHLHAFADEHTEGHIGIAVSGNEDEAVIVVSDDGCGMDEAHREQIFKPFFTTRRGAGGSGLGLSIVYNLVHHRLGGRIRADSAPGQGSRFEVVLPRTVARGDSER